MTVQSKYCQCWVCCHFKKIRPNEKRKERTIDRTRDYEAIGYHFTEWLRIGFTHDDYDQLKNLLTEKEFKRMLDISRRLCHYQDPDDKYLNECHLRLGHDGRHEFSQYGSITMNTAQIIIGEKLNVR